MEGQSERGPSSLNVSTGTTSKVQKRKRSSSNVGGAGQKKRKRRWVKRVQKWKAKAHTKKEDKKWVEQGVVGTFNVTDKPLDMDPDDSFEEYHSSSSVTDSPPPARK